MSEIITILQSVFYERNMITNLILVLLLPLVGTVLGSFCVFFMKDKISPSLERALSGFAAGVMVAASVWSLLIPAIDMTEGLKGFLPIVAGFWAGMLFLLLLDHIIPHLHNHGTEDEGPKSHLKRTTKLVLAVTLHNLPEGMAVGAVCAAWLSQEMSITFLAAFALAAGIAIQNFPEGAIISMPLRAEGVSKKRAFLYGSLSGIVEPLGAVLTVFLASLILPFLPSLLGFAAGAMLYVVVEELIPEMAQGEHSNVGTLMFALGFSLMMMLDILLG